MGIVQNGVGQTHHLAVGLVRGEDAGAHPADILRQTHHQFLADRVNSGVRYLGELLTEIVEEYLRFVRQDGKWRVITHRCRWLLSIDSHRHDGVRYILFSIAEHHFLLEQVADMIVDMSAGLQLLQLDAVGTQPLAIGVFAGELLFDLTIIVYLTLLCVDKQDLTRLQAPFLCNLSRVKVHHANLTCHHHCVVLRNGIAGRTESVTVQHATSKTSVTEQQGGRTIPRLHQDGVVFVESLQILANRVLVIETLWYKHAHCMWQ